MLRSARPRKLKLVPCKICGEPFPKLSMQHRACSVPCALELVKRDKERADRKQKLALARKDRRDIQQRREAIKSIPQLKKEAQIAFNAFIRFRDRDQPCICCDSFGKSGEALTGGKWDCGHYRSTGSADHLRFDERNAHRQLKDCNRWGAGRAVDYRIGLINRIGLDAVLAVESDHRIIKWTREALIAIRTLYKAKLKTLKAEDGMRLVA